jgi:hypothetical protein
MSAPQAEQPQGRSGIFLAIVFTGLLVATATFSFHRGYRVGSLDMRDTMMCVMDRISAQPIGKGTSAYCGRVAGSREDRHGAS